MDKAKAVSELNVTNQKTSTYGGDISIRCGYSTEYDVELTGITIHSDYIPPAEGGQNEDGSVVESLHGSVSFRITERVKEPEPEVSQEAVDSVDEVPA